MKRVLVIVLLLLCAVGCNELDSPSDPNQNVWWIQVSVIVNGTPVHGWSVNFRDDNFNVFQGETDEGLAPGQDQFWIVYENPSRARIEVEGTVDFTREEVEAVTKWNPLLNRNVTLYTVIEDNR